MIAELPGARIWYEDTGASGIPVVLLHARSGSSALWQAQLEAFAAAGYRVIAFDRRGHGRTEVAPAGASTVTGADDLQALAELLGLGKFHLVGTAAGGIVALDYALSFGERVRSLVVANSIGGVQDEDYVALQRRLRPAPQFDALPVQLRELGPAYRAADPAGEARWLKLEQAARRSDSRALPQTRNRITFALLETLRAPALLITGDADLYTPPPVLELFKQRIQHARTLVLPRCGHSAYWEQPALFNRAVLDFLAAH